MGLHLLKGDSRYSHSHITIPLQTPGETQEMLCLPFRKLPGWLFSPGMEKISIERNDHRAGLWFLSFLGGKTSPPQGGVASLPSVDSM